MKTFKNFTISKEIFDAFPGMKLIVVIARNIDNSIIRPAISTELTKAWAAAGDAALEYGNPQSHPRVKAWVDHFKAIGVSRKKFPSSIEALIRRASKDDKPVSINPMVDFYNTISLKYVVTAGGYDIDQLENGLDLRFSRQGDTFQALDDPEPIPIPEGEVSYAEGSHIVTRHFIWRQSKIGLVHPESKNVLLLSEIPALLGEELYLNVMTSLIEGVKTHFQVTPDFYTMDSGNLKISI